jgi:hypothetical protein
LGASSPKISVKNEITSVTTMSDTAAAGPDESGPVRACLRWPASRSAPNAPDSRVAKVTPIWTDARNRFGSWASRAAR